jgi:hypothetical protein
LLEQFCLLADKLRTFSQEKTPVPGCLRQNSVQKKLLTKSTRAVDMNKLYQPKSQMAGSSSRSAHYKNGQQS